MHFEVYRRRLSRQPWRWRLRADNGEIIASGEAYRRQNDAMHAVQLVRTSRLAEIEVLP